jgi:hypothetical protein
MRDVKERTHRELCCTHIKVDVEKGFHLFLSISARRIRLVEILGCYNLF